MRRGVGDAVTRTSQFCVFLGGLALIVWPKQAPLAVVPSLLLGLATLTRAYRAARGTALRAAVLWSFVALSTGLITEILAWTEPPNTGRSVAGHLAYLTTLAALAALISVLNARTPGGGAWAILMSLLILVFLIPWLEGAGLGRGPTGLARLRLDNPWTIFYGLLVLAGVTNYLPTRFGFAAAWLGFGFVSEFVGLTQTDRSAAERATIWAAVPWTFAAAVVTAEMRAKVRPEATSRLDAVWLWFRDHWGVVWALRVMERFNRSAEAARWPVRLAWHGVVGVGGEAVVATEIPEAALATLTGLLRRFAEPERVALAASCEPEPPCQPSEGRR